MIWAGLELMGEMPFTDVIIHSTVLAADGRRMSKSLGTGVDPLEMIEAHGADATRYGLLKISSTQDVRFSPGAIEEGRKLANKLWNVSRLILQNAEGVEPDVQPTALEERGSWPGSNSRGNRSRRHGGIRLRDRNQRALPPHVRRLLRLVRRGREAAPLRAEADGMRDRARRARAPAGIAPPGHAARDRGDLVASAGERNAADRVGVAGAGRPPPRRERSARPVQEAAVTFRRSGVQVALDSDDERRVFAAVVRPERQKAPGDAAPRSRAWRRRSRAPRRCSPTSASWPARLARSSRPSARSSSGSGASSRHSEARLPGPRETEARRCEPGAWQ